MEKVTYQKHTDLSSAIFLAELQAFFAERPALKQKNFAEQAQITTVHLRKLLKTDPKSGIKVLEPTIERLINTMKVYGYRHIEMLSDQPGACSTLSISQIEGSISIAKQLSTSEAYITIQDKSGFKGLWVDADTIEAIYHFCRHHKTLK